MLVRNLRKRAAKIFLNNSLLITRPLQESLVFSGHVYNLNQSIRTICAPLFEIEIIKVEKDLSEVTTIIVTSSNAIKSLKKSQIVFNGKVFCVGNSTELFAQKAGFCSISSARNLNSLITLIQKSMSNEIEKLVYFRGEEVFADLVGSLRNQHFNINEVICYRKSQKKK
jgi:uroporphyrinogen-III synthase